MNERQQRINDYIQSKNEVSLSDLKQLVPDVSEMTIRRDLEALENSGRIVRIHGGARSVKAINMLVEDAFSKRSAANVEKKRIICEKALAYIEDNSSIYIDAGSTTMTLAEMIPDKQILVSTCALNIAAELLKQKNGRVNLIGGEVNKNSISTYGPGARAAIENINIDVAFIASTAFSEKNGFSCGNVYDCELKCAILKKATLRIMLMDSSKIGTMMPYTFAHPCDIDILITDDGISNELRSFFIENGTIVL
ncbi:MAG: DeoR/GlpR transcriptional regulator [Oscillospiraceae bacterium]|nr:DeoR/GlpR transcriptional regulator [Oscillospiraceae bacterium]MBQ9984679.1 DeoR/GlpR transcriptional regulator [Oscillospiraceae bacterium]